MISGLDLNETIDYTIESDSDPKAVFKLGVISSYMFARISSTAKDAEVQTAFKVLQLALKGWENFNVPFETVKEKMFDREIDVVPISILERFPLRLVTELSMKVMEINQLTETERKN